MAYNNWTIIRELWPLMLTCHYFIVRPRRRQSFPNEKSAMMTLWIVPGSSTISTLRFVSVTLATQRAENFFPIFYAIHSYLFSFFMNSAQVIRVAEKERAHGTRSSGHSVSCIIHPVVRNYKFGRGPRLRHNNYRRYRPDVASSDLIDFGVVFCWATP
jgi:hypothetical protein